VIRRTHISDPYHARRFGNRPKSEQIGLQTGTPEHSRVTPITNRSDAMHGVFRLPLAS